MLSQASAFEAMGRGMLAIAGAVVFLAVLLLCMAALQGRD